MPNGQGTAKTLSRVRGTRGHHFFVPSPLIGQTKTWYRHSSQSSKAAPAHPRPLANTSSSWHPRRPQCSILWTPAHTKPNSSCSTKEPWHGAHPRIPPAHTHPRSSHPANSAPVQHALGPSQAMLIPDPGRLPKPSTHTITQTMC